MEINELKIVVIKTANIRERSWNSQTQRYNKDFYQSVKEAVAGGETIEVATIVPLLLEACWRDALEWAHS